MSANRNAEAPPAPPGTSRRPERQGERWNKLGLAVYGAEAGIVATAAGAWASSGLSGTGQIAVWLGVTTVLVGLAVCVARPAVTLLARCFRTGWKHRPSAPR